MVPKLRRVVLLQSASGDEGMSTVASDDNTIIYRRRRRVDSNVATLCVSTVIDRFY